MGKKMSEMSFPPKKSAGLPALRLLSSPPYKGGTLSLPILSEG